MKLQLETNTRNALDFHLQLPTGAILMMTAPLLSDRWIFRVALGKDAALLAVPQFGGVNICLQSLGSCQISIPYETDAAEIVRAINDGAPSLVSVGKAMEAVRVLKAAITSWRCGAKVDSSPSR